MARGATTRSQRAPKASQSQTQASTSQRSQRLSRHDEDEDEDEEQPGNDDDEEEEVIKTVESVSVCSFCSNRIRENLNAWSLGPCS